MMDIKKIGNLGAGTMGHATALQFAMSGYDVTVVDTAQPALDRGRKLIERDLDTFIKSGMVKAEDRDAVLSRISMTTDYEALADVDFIIESVLENLEVKHDVWKKVEGIVSDQTILATNTSGLSPSAIASGLQHPGRFVVAHFWNPAQLMPLVEVVPGEKTDQETVDVTVELMNHIGKHAVPLKTESLGFVGNRIQLAVIRECLNIVNRGIATPEAVDDIVKYSLGRRWAILGPIASADLGGLDVFDNISKYLYDDLACETGEDTVLKAKVEAGELGSKSGKGFYDWQGEQAAQTIQSRDDQLLEALARDSKKQG
ncbi:3-hydroxyacyl-CoA dehydrogenase family protein [Bifidobacterium sp. ESL0728]|uniref:3-hydroxyacyl-CoA dehydrogenase family protein n=1 Tax=Bifidobacterium sp. ESL0728 TaxID=2983220 RepID=UPI0023F73559|nr:3-hydroxyacyl-CoA dehydrogenase family protein [Bifidobacterium sp. ESL0728]WEV60014.1 3-hydroxyacyl-CoA dehydrogenase family protein [Bifidobacterium sp. ESL0728]